MSYVNFKRNLTRAQIEALGSSGHDSATDGKVYFATDGGIYLGASDGKAYPKADITPERLGIEQKTDQEFRFRKTGVDWDARAELITKFKGKTLVWNQIILPFNSWTGNNGTISYSDNILTYTVSTVVSSYAQSTGCYGTIKIVNTHKYYHSIDIKCDKDSSIYLGGDAFGNAVRGRSITANTWSRLRFLSTASTTNSVNYYISLTSSTGGVAVGDKMYIGAPMMVDLTLLYGSEIDGMTDAQILTKFQSEFPEPYYPYNAGTLISNDTESIETVGFNQWDEEWDLKNRELNGTEVTSPYYLTNKTPIRAIPNTGYYFYVEHPTRSDRQVYYLEWDTSLTLITRTRVDSQLIDATNSKFAFMKTSSNNALYVGLFIYSGTTWSSSEISATRCCINLSDASRNGTYEPYKKSTLLLNLQSFKVKSPNIWDEEWEVGLYNTTTGEKQSGILNIRSKNIIPVSPGQTYYFKTDGKILVLLRYDASGNYIYTNNLTDQSYTIPEGCYYITFYLAQTYGTTYQNNITINLSDPAFNGRYFSHEDITIEGGLKGNGAWADYKDGKKYVKKANRVNLAGLPFAISYADSYHVFLVNNLQNYFPNFPTARGGGVGAVCDKYQNVTWTKIANYQSNGCDKVFCLSDSQMGSNAIVIRDTSYATNDAFRTAMSGVYLDYELQYPETYELITPIPDFIRCDKDGTERVIGPDPDTPSAPFVADIQYGIDSGDVAEEVDKSMVYASGDTVAVVGGVNSGDSPITKIKIGDTVHDIKDGNNPWESGENDYTAQGKEPNTTASGQYSLAYGKRAIAAGQISTAIGGQLSANGQCSIALGSHAVAAGQCSFARGGNWIIGLQLSGSANATTYSFTVDSADFEYFNRLYNMLGSNELVNLMKLTYIRYIDGSYDVWKKITNATITASGGSVTGGTITLESTLSTAAITNKSGYLIIQVAAGKGSISDGNGSVAIGRSSHAEGEQTIARNQSEHAQGERNYSHKASSTFGDAGNTIYSIGIGTTGALNALEIMQNGDAYLYGAGGYDGTNPSASFRLQDMLPSMVETTWANLKSLRDNSQLIKGMQYRITDYHTTVSDLINDARSADHQFDIVVVADAPNKLNENVRAALHSGDTYFSTAGAKLEAWELKYCLDNDTTRFSWGLAPHVAGILVPDFTSELLEKTNQTITVDGQTWYIFGSQSQAQEYWGDDENVYFACPNQNPVVDEPCYLVIWDDDEYISDEGFEITSVVSASSMAGTGIVYWMKDENNNECPYDFKNIQFKVGAKAQAGTVDNVFYYTFSLVSGTNDATVEDHTLNSTLCYNNKIKAITYGKITLNFNIFRNTDKGSECYSNTFGNDCPYNTFGNSCFNNTFGNSCYSNTFGNYCYSNTFGNSCYSNTFGNSCYSNTFENYCYSNTFGNDCPYNTFGNSCHSNTLGSNCRNNAFGSNCSYNTFGDSCRDNTFGNYCSRNNFGSNCDCNTFGNGCLYIYFGNGSQTKSYCSYIIIESGNQYIRLNCSATTSPFAHYQNVKIAQGVNNTTTYKTITDSNVGQTSQTVYL